MTDQETLNVYATRAQDYANLVDDAAKADPSLRAFMDDLPPGASVLDLGCGPGRSAALMAAEGFKVSAWDPVAEMIALASQHPGVTARQAGFDDLIEADAFDGIWANFSLLHAPRRAMPDHLDAICNALRPGGVFHIGTKLGTGEARDSIGRLYTYYEAGELENLLTERGLHIVARRFGEEAGLDGQMAKFIVLRAHA